MNLKHFAQTIQPGKNFSTNGIVYIWSNSFGGVVVGKNVVAAIFSRVNGIFCHDGAVFSLVEKH
jgi:hypothetical protein